MKKINNKILIITLLALVGVFVLSKVFRSPKLESNLRKDLVSVDTATVTELRVAPTNSPGKIIKLTRNGKMWLVENDGKKFSADISAIKNALGTLTALDAERMVSRKKEKWETFNVGEKATNVSVYVDGDQKANLFIGKSGFTQGGGGPFGGGGYTYVRLSDEDEVYSVKGFLESTFNRSFNDWRDKALLRVNRDEIRKISFTYRGDSSFVMEKKDSLWYAGTQLIDQSKLDSYLSQVSFKNLNSFADSFNAPVDTDALIKIEGSSGELATIEAWKDAAGWTLRSSLQKEVFFSGSGTSVDKDILVGPKHFGLSR